MEEQYGHYYVPTTGMYQHSTPSWRYKDSSRRFRVVFQLVPKTPCSFDVPGVGEFTQAYGYSWFSKLEHQVGGEWQTVLTRFPKCYPPPVFWHSNVVYALRVWSNTVPELRADIRNYKLGCSGQIPGTVGFGGIVVHPPSAADSLWLAGVCGKQGWECGPMPTLLDINDPLDGTVCYHEGDGWSDANNNEGEEEGQGGTNCVEELGQFSDAQGTLEFEPFPGSHGRYFVLPGTTETTCTVLNGEGDIAFFEWAFDDVWGREGGQPYGAEPGVNGVIAKGVGMGCSESIVVSKPVARRWSVGSLWSPALHPWGSYPFPLGSGFSGEQGPGYSDFAWNGTTGNTFCNIPDVSTAYEGCGIELEWPGTPGWDAEGDTYGPQGDYQGSCGRMFAAMNALHASYTAKKLSAHDPDLVVVTTRPLWTRFVSRNGRGGWQWWHPGHGKWYAPGAFYVGKRFNCPKIGDCEPVHGIISVALTKPTERVDLAETWRDGTRVNATSLHDVPASWTDSSSATGGADSEPFYVGNMALGFGGGADGGGGGSGTADGRSLTYSETASAVADGTRAAVGDVLGNATIYEQMRAALLDSGFGGGEVGIGEPGPAVGGPGSGSGAGGNGMGGNIQGMRDHGTGVAAAARDAMGLSQLDGLPVAGPGTLVFEVEIPWVDGDVRTFYIDLIPDPETDAGFGLAYAAAILRMMLLAGLHVYFGWSVLNLIGKVT